ncbi:hypothetical protein [Clostridium sp.]|uniref:hypothetical protein n=1 Tax=Clostridium sp. TaxID=1506 RepID=UPI0026156736|nr:hypothetical protein [Clostridium sp.]
MRKPGKKDLYGLCSPTKENETTFDYGIGVIINEDTDYEIYPDEGEPGLFCELWIPIRKIS